jgi:nitroreductase
MRSIVILTYIYTHFWVPTYQKRADMQREADQRSNHMNSPLFLDPRIASHCPLDVPSAIHARRSVRHYARTPVEPEMLDTVVGLALEAPSSWNLQDRHIVLVQSETGLAHLAEATGGQPQTREAPLVAVFLADLSAHKTDRSNIWEDARRTGAWSEAFIDFFAPESQAFQEILETRGLLREYAIKDAMIAASFFMLAATSFGLATSPMNGWDEALVKKAVNADGHDDIVVALLVAMGYPAETPKHPGRQPRDRNVFHERFSRPEPWGTCGRATASSALREPLPPLALDGSTHADIGSGISSL